MKYLYLLPFKDKKHFKIGISEGNDSRIVHHNRTYGIIMREAMVIKSKESAYIRALETELLSIFPICDHGYGDVDGYTEIREIKYLDECLDIIKNKHPRLEVTISSYRDVFKKEVKVPISKTVMIDHDQIIKEYWAKWEYYKRRFSRVSVDSLKLKLQPNEKPRDIFDDLRIIIDDGNRFSSFGTVGAEMDKETRECIFRFFFREDLFRETSQEEKLLDIYEEFKKIK